MIGISELSHLSDLVQIRSVHRAVLHQEYNPRKETNDIALIQLDRPVTFDDLTQPACLPSALMAVTSLSPCYISGWGSTTQNSEGLCAGVPPSSPGGLGAGWTGTDWAALDQPHTWGHAHAATPRGMHTQIHLWPHTHALQL